MENGKSHGKLLISGFNKSKTNRVSNVRH
jgi:hypothetical protein